MLNPSTTPARVSVEIRAFAREVAAEGALSFVTVEASADSEPGECFENVRARVARDGGRLQYGWIIWEWPRIQLQAEFHAVWAAEHGGLVDVTPTPDGEHRILFLTDPVRVLETGTDGMGPDNIRKALNHNPLIIEYQAVSAAEVALRRKHSIGRIGHPPAAEYEGLLDRKAELLAALLRWSTGRNDPCPCGSSKKYKRCCQRSEH